MNSTKLLEGNSVLTAKTLIYRAFPLIPTVLDSANLRQIWGKNDAFCSIIQQIFSKLPKGICRIFKVIQCSFSVYSHGQIYVTT